MAALRYSRDPVSPPPVENVVYEGVIQTPGTTEYLLSDARLRVQAGDIDFGAYLALANDAVFGNHPRESSVAELASPRITNSQRLAAVFFGSVIVDVLSGVERSKELGAFGLATGTSAAILYFITQKRNKHMQGIAPDELTVGEERKQLLALHTQETESSL